MVFSCSQFGVDIYEIDNSVFWCGWLFDEVVGDVEVVVECCDEIIVVMVKIVKFYFGDVVDMIYLQWLWCYVELVIGEGNLIVDIVLVGSLWLVDIWWDCFEQMLQCVEVWLYLQDFGLIQMLFIDVGLLDNLQQVIVVLLVCYFDVEIVQLYFVDVFFFVMLCKMLGKLVNFVLVIDQDVWCWWCSDLLWQVYDVCYDVDVVCIILGIVLVVGIIWMDEFVGELLDCFE